MKKILTLCTAISAGLAAQQCDASPRNIIAYVPNQMDETAARGVYDHILGMITEIGPETRLEVISNPGISQVFDLQTPSEMSDHPAWLRDLLQPSVQALQTFATRAYQNGSAAGAMVPANQVGLHDIISVLPRRAVEEPVVIIFGSARDNTPDDEANNTVTRFPNDAFLDMPIQSSRFGTSGLEDTLNGMQVHVCLIDTGYSDPRHPDMLERYTSLRLEAMGGVLASWTPDLDECVRRAVTGREDGQRQFSRNLAEDTPGYFEIENVVAIPPTDLQVQVDLLDDMPLQEEDRETLLDLVRVGEVQLVSVSVFDTSAEDGDVVEISAGNVAYSVPLFNQPRQVILPVIDGRVTMRGIADGGGGITVGIETADGSQSFSPVMRVGQVVTVPFFLQ